MEKRNETFHSFKIAPESLAGILGKNVSQKKDPHKNSHRTPYPRKFRSVFMVTEGKKQPGSKNYFCNDSKRKILAGYKRKKKLPREWPKVPILREAPSWRQRARGKHRQSLQPLKPNRSLLPAK